METQIYEVIFWSVCSFLVGLGIGACFTYWFVTSVADLLR